MTCQVYCSRACKIQEDELRSAEAGALGKLAGISATQDVDLDLLRMMLRLVVTRARALGLRPEQKKEVDAEGVGSAEHQEGVAAEEVRTDEDEDQHRRAAVRNVCAGVNMTSVWQEKPERATW